jgi:hypothetical protein
MTTRFQQSKFLQAWCTSPSTILRTTTGYVDQLSRDLTIALRLFNQFLGSISGLRLHSVLTFSSQAIRAQGRFECDDDGGYFRDTHHQVWVRSSPAVNISRDWLV